MSLAIITMNNGEVFKETSRGHIAGHREDWESLLSSSHHSLRVDCRSLIQLSNVASVRFDEGGE